jgi:hypothetical protein
LPASGRPLGERAPQALDDLEARDIVMLPRSSLYHFEDLGDGGFAVDPHEKVV